MAINEHYNRQLLINFYDHNGTLSGITQNLPKTYSRIRGLREKNAKDMSINDYIYTELGVKPRGRLGAELTFLINNHLLEYGTLKNYKSANFAYKLKKLATEYGTTAEDLLSEADYAACLTLPTTFKNYSHLNILYYLSSLLLKQLIDNAKPEILDIIQNYFEEVGHFNTFAEDQPQIYHVLLESIDYPCGGFYKDETETLPNGDVIYTADVMYQNGQMFFKGDKHSVPIVVSKETLLRECLYAMMGYMPKAVLCPSMLFALEQHLNYYKTLLHLNETNPRLYNEIKRIYLSSPEYTSIADMLQKEGYYYPRMSEVNSEYLPSQDGEHIIYVSTDNPHYIILNREMMAFLLERQMSDKLLVKPNNTGTYYVAYEALTDKRTKEYPPFHNIYTNRMDTVYVDGNFLNISTDNLEIGTDEEGELEN